MGYSRKIEMELYGVSKDIEKKWKFQGLIKKEVELPGEFKKKSCGISMSLGFWPWNFQSLSHNFAELLQDFQECKSLFSLEFVRVKVTNVKFPEGEGIRKVYPQPLFGFNLE